MYLSTVKVFYRKALMTFEAERTKRKTLHIRCNVLVVSQLFCCSLWLLWSDHCVDRCASEAISPSGPATLNTLRLIYPQEINQATDWEAQTRLPQPSLIFPTGIYRDLSQFSFLVHFVIDVIALLLFAWFSAYSLFTMAFLCDSVYYSVSKKGIK